MIAHIFQTLFPVFAVIGLGFFLARIAFLSRNFLNELNRFVYFVALPVLMLHYISSVEQLPPGTIGIWLIYVTASFGIIVAGLLAARMLHLERWQFGTFVQIAFRGNLGFIGMPILAYAFRNQEDAVVTSVMAQAALIFAPTMIFYNIVSVFLLLGSHENDFRKSIPRILKNISRNPLIIACIVGLTIFVLPWDLPLPVTNTLEFVGKTAGPAALICVGGGMAHVSMQGRYRSALTASALKVFGVPLIAWLVSLPFAFSPTATLILMVFSATPTAVAGYVMAKEMHGDEAMASGGIFYSTLLSMASLAIVIGLF